MNRRELLKKTGLSITIGAVALKAIPSFAQSSETNSELIGEIGTNHGHAVTPITGDELMMRARDLNGDDTIEIDIQGGSNHPHAILLSKEDVAALLVGEEVELNSVGGSHSHTVNLVLEKI